VHRIQTASEIGFNRRKLEDQRRATAAKEAASRRATDVQVLEDAERLIAAWNERQVERMPMLFSPTIGAAIAAQYWFLWIRCPACRTINAIDLRVLVQQDIQGFAVAFAPWGVRKLAERELARSLWPTPRYALHQRALGSLLHYIAPPYRTGPDSYSAAAAA
jgi:hypothetical protein